jgi:hypothetical protein
MDWSEKVAKLTDAEFPEARPRISLIHSRILIGLDPLQPQSQVDQDIVGILSNANTTTQTAYELWRRGLLLQTGTLLRNAIEASAFAVSLRSNPEKHGRYRTGQLSSTNAISQAVRNLGSVGRDIVKLWGELSKHFVHISPVLSPPSDLAHRHSRGQVTPTDCALRSQVELLFARSMYRILPV